MPKLLIAALVFVFFILPISQSRAQSTSDPNVCLKTCIETYGTEKKQACALQCGFGSGATGGGQARDCGTRYKQCMTQCRSDAQCKSTCRKQRTQCY